VIISVIVDRNVLVVLFYFILAQHEKSKLSRSTHMSTHRTTDVVIIGEGVIGCSIAYQLCKAGIAVTLV
jgi:NADPH-dependent 2,4-dienoyl-CoA reductase/sulfur reductase-like enzyme